MIHLYHKDNTNYEKNGDVILLPYKCEVTAGINRTWQVDLEHPIDDEGRWKSIVADAVIKCPSFNGVQLWRIVQTEKRDSGVAATCDPIFYDAAHEVVFVERLTINNVTCQKALDTLTKGTKFSGDSHIEDVASMWFETENLVEAVTGNEHGLVKHYDCEVAFDNYSVHMEKELGGDYGASVVYGKNLAVDGITESFNIDGTITRIIPIAYNGHTLPELYVDSELIDNYPFPRVGFIQYDNLRLYSEREEGEEGDSTTEYFNSLEELYTAMRDAAKLEYTDNELDRPTVGLEVDMVLIQNTEEYKDFKDLEKVSIGDYVRCYNPKINIDSKTRVRALTYDAIREAVTFVELGKEKRNYFDNVTSMIDRVGATITSSGTVMAEKIAGLINGAYAQLRIQNTVAKKQDVRAILFEDLDPASPTFGALAIGTQGWQISTERTQDGRDWVWTTAATSKGIIADTVVAGTLTDKTGTNYWNLDTGDFRLGDYIERDELEEAVEDAVSDLKNAPRVYYGTCSTAAGTATKEVTVDSKHGTPIKGDQLQVRFTNANTAAAPKIAVDGGTAKNITAYGATLVKDSPYTWDAGAVVEFVYDGTNWTISDATALKRLDDLDSDLNSEGVFNRLTNNGEMQGIVRQDGKIYINGEYIQANTLSADKIKTGILTSKTGKGFSLNLDDGSIDLVGYATDEKVKEEIEKAEAYTDAQISDMTIGGNNILRGTHNFRLGSGRWQTASWRASGGTPVVEQISDSPVAGINKAIKLTASNTTGEFGFCQDSYKMQGHIGEQLTFSVWVKGTAGDTVRLQPYWTSVSGEAETARYTHTLKTSTWERITYTSPAIKYNHNGISIGYVYFKSATANRTCLVVAPKLEWGTKATDWSIAPEDAPRRNLLKQSGRQINTNAYNMVDYYWGDEAPVAGESYFLTMEGTLGSGKTQFWAYNSGGSTRECILTADGTGRWFGEIPSWQVGANGNTYLRIYHAPSSVTGVNSTIKWIKLEKGNYGTDYTVAPEDARDAQTTANTAQTAANNAQTTANTANSTANTANARATYQYGTCSTAAGTAAKVVTLANFPAVYTGAECTVTFTNKNTANSPTLNVNNTGAYPIYARGSALTGTSGYNWEAGATVEFIFDGSRWVMMPESMQEAVNVLAGTNANAKTQVMYVDSGKVYINADHINTGTLDASVVSVTKLNASNISSGTLSADRIGANSIAVGKLTGSISNGNWKIDLNAGTFTIGNISASNISSGTLTLGGASNGSGVLRVNNSSGTRVGYWDNSGAYFGNIASNLSNPNIKIGTDGTITAKGTSSYTTALSTGGLASIGNGITLKVAGGVLSIDNGTTYHTYGTGRYFSVYQDGDSTDGTGGVSITSRSINLNGSEYAYAKTSSYINAAANAYKAIGETLSFSGGPYAGHVTSSTKELVFFIPSYKSLQGRTLGTITKPTSFTVRTAKGTYMNGASGGIAASGLTVTGTLYSNGLKISATSSSAYTSVDNNTPLTVWINGSLSAYIK